MHTRHRIPTIFNLSMVDVLCCALGCVIFLWLVNFREAKRRAKTVGETGARLVEARASLEGAKRELASVRDALAASQARERLVASQLEETQSDRDRARQQALATKRDYDDTRAALQTALADAGGLRKDLKALQASHTQVTAALADKKKEFAGLEQRLREAGTMARTLEMRLEEKAEQLADAGGRVQDLMARLQESGAQVKKLEKQVRVLRAEGMDARAKLSTELAEAQGAYRALLESRRDLDKQLAERGREISEARSQMARLQVDKRALEAEARRARQAAENRFAGIALTGRRVIFLVDMSGSMDLIDEQTPAPDKWPLVCETLARIMTSLPDLTDYQVIVFSDKVRYALGNDRRWFKYEKDSSAKKVSETLKKIKPKGATDMASAFAEAFQFRAKGLDTLYVFSDGLPNAGAGLPPGAENLSETQRTAYCSKYVRHMLKFAWNRRTPGQPPVRIHAVGFFFESPDVGAFLWAMAREHDGSFVGMSRP